ncbi:hypothetical protein FVQ98_14585 [Ottowia sp. GY511]|uniref:Antiterminator Q family protein n=1 Tax=Ottowia flava TaxID=2675430 RepID=A0ABW4KPQ9_9BURK|nr:antiterminator Q family protein [Ottowia sp. GY511]TXK26381.1 hypothetical protein FVQ98_14585 [Ottowia sp. GY511]
MARIEWVRQRLENWARWTTQRSEGALGYPKQSAFARLAGRGRRADTVIPIDSVDASLTDDAVQALRWERPHLYLTLVHIYVQGSDIKRTAVKLCKAESTIKAHLEQADQALAMWFRDRARLADEVRQRAAGGFTT